MMTMETALGSNPQRIVWDIETDGLLGTASKLWCICIHDLDTGVTELFSSYDKKLRGVPVALEIISKASTWVGHNLIGYDIPVLRHFGYVLPDTEVHDTLITSQVVYPQIADAKFKHRIVKNKWSHSLEAWGRRAGFKKLKSPAWDKYSDYMGEYCIRDVKLNAVVYTHLKRKARELGIGWEFRKLPAALAVEHQFKTYTTQQELTGFPFDIDKARELHTYLMSATQAIEFELQRQFPPITKTIHYVTPKRKIPKSKTVTEVFNPRSRSQIGKRLIDAGWEPREYTATGKPTVNEKTLADAALVVPLAESLSTYLSLSKLMGMVSDGENAWLKLVTEDGRIHGSVNTLKAVTTRVSHSNPNLSQVPAAGSELGTRCRECFTARPGWILVGADLSGIELRCLAHYLAHWDNGDYGESLLTGDIHTVHQEAYGLPSGKEWRSVGKTITYAYLYGAGDWKLGASGKASGTKDEVAAVGARFRSSVEGNIPALGKLVAAVKRKRAKGDNYIRSITGHRLFCRSEHSALNTLLQSAGAQIAKTWYVLFHQEMADLGYVYGEHYETYGFFHDEIQSGCLPELSDTIGQILVNTARLAGELIGFRLPVDAEYSTGFRWSDTH